MLRTPSKRTSPRTTTTDGGAAPRPPIPHLCSQPAWAIAGAVLAAQGLILLMGVAHRWRWGKLGELTFVDVHPALVSAAGSAAGLSGAFGAAVVVAIALSGRAPGAHR